MRTLRNLTWFLLAFGLTIWAGVANAQVPDYYYGGSYGGSGTQYGKSQDEVCAAVLGKVAGYSYTHVVITGSTSFGCYAIKPGINNGEPHRVFIGTRFQCSVAKPYFTGGSCRAEEPPPSCKAGETNDYTWKSGPRGGANNYSPYSGQPNDGGCDLKCKQVKECFSKPNSSTPDIVYCIHVCEKTGNPKSSGDSSDTSQNHSKESGDNRDDMPPTDSPKGPCPIGTVQVGVNSDGIPRCQGTGSEPKNPKPKPPTIEKEDTKDNGDGSSTTTKTSVTSNADGSKTTVTTTTVTAADGSKTTTETRDTTKSPNGDSGKDDSKKEDEKYDLCKQNPNLTICQNSSVAGKCGEVSCQGDAIQCATLRAAAAMQCKQQSDEDQLKASPLTAKGTAAINGADLEGLPNSKNAEIVNIPTLGAQGWLGNGAAFRDVSITVQGKQIVVPLSKWSDYLLPLRYVMMIIASLISYRILAGAIVRA